MRKGIRDITMNNEIKLEYYMIAATIAMGFLTGFLVNAVFSLFIH